MTAKKLRIARALALKLERLNSPVLNRYDIARVAWHLYKSKQFEEYEVDVRRDHLDRPSFLRVESDLLDSGALSPLPGMPEASVYTLLGGNVGDRNVIACAIDPFCYVSHLSAMDFHGITDRMPEHLYLSTPAGTNWTHFAEQRMQRDLGEDYMAFLQARLPTLRRVKVDRIDQRPIHRHASLHLGAYRSIKDPPMRVASLGRTFLDMLREPNLCGGISHVLDVFIEHAPRHLRLVLDEIDQHGKPIDKMRAGYVLEELCGVRDPRIDSWSALATRGGSRKLDPASAYAPEFSERWCLSINTTLPAAAGHD